MSPGDEYPECGISRRDFAQFVTALAAGAGIANAGHADEPTKPAITPLQAVEALIRERFGKHLTEEQVKKLTQRVMSLRASSEALKRVPLTNADEPAVVFHAD